MKRKEAVCNTVKPDSVTENLDMNCKLLGTITSVSKKSKRKKVKKYLTNPENGEDCREDTDKQFSKRLKVDSFNSETSAQTLAGETVSTVVHKKKKKRKKKNNNNKEYGSMQSDVVLNDEPNPKRLKKDTSCIEQLPSSQVASVTKSFSETINAVATNNKKKKKAKASMYNGDAKPSVKEQLHCQISGASLDFELASKNSSENLTEVRKKKKKRKKGGTNKDNRELQGTSNINNLVNASQEVTSETVSSGSISVNNEGKKKKKKKKRSSRVVMNRDNGKLEVISNNSNAVDGSWEITSETVSSGRESVSSEAKKKKKKKKKGESGVVTMEIAQENNQIESKKRKKRKKENAKNKALKTNGIGNYDSEVSSEVKLENTLSRALNHRVEKLGNGKVEQNKSEQIKKKQKKKSKISSSVSLSMEENGSIKHPKKVPECEIISDTSPRLSNVYSDKAWKGEITKCWNLQSHLKKENGFELLAEPFRCTYMPGFLQDSDFLHKVVEELSEIDTIEKNNDLYKFHQTPDLKNVSSPHISSLRRFLYGDFRKWLTDITGIELNDTVDMGSSRYEYTDVLLCHDDELEGRRIAYILYLVPEWDNKDGGMLDLFNTDQNGLPKDIVKSLLPRWNTFAFFEVSPVSFHQVHEVLSNNKVRLTINGWFHGSDIKRPPKYIESPRPVLSPVHIEQDELYSWINPSYLDMDTQRTIRKKFQSDSEIELESFLCTEKYEELTSSLQSANLKWCKMGPANKQSCKILKQKNLPEIIKNCCKFFQSEALFLILSQLTGLKLHRLAPPDSDPDSDSEEEDDKKDSSPGMVIDVRKWSHGCYTLLRDDQGDETSALDAMFFLHVGDRWSLKQGGFTSYITKDEDEELLTVIPQSNCLALVYRDCETLRFTKYINTTAKDLGKQNSFFYDVSCTYFE